MRRRLWSALLVLAPASTWAQPTPPPSEETAAVVLVGDCTSPGVAALPRAFRNTLKSLGTPVLTEQETVAPLGGVSLRSMADLKRALGDARDDFINGQVQRALQSLQGLTEDVARLAPSAERWDLERSALTSLAQVQARTDKAAADRILRQILAVDPDYLPDPATFPPSFVAEVNTLRNEFKLTRLNRLDVTADPAGTKVVVGGKPFGAAPVTLHLPAATYRLEGMWGYRGLASSVKVESPPALPASAELSKAKQGSILPDAGPCVFPVPDRNAAVVRLASLLPVKRIYAVRVEGTGNEQTIAVEEYDTATNRVLAEQREPVVPPGPVSDAAARLAETVTGKVPGAPAPPPSTVNGGLRLWSYILGGVGIAATAVGVVLYINGNSTINNLSTTYMQGYNGNPNSFQPGYESTFQSNNNSGKNDKTLGVVLGGVGVAALATGVALFIVSAHGGGPEAVTVVPSIQPGAGAGVVLAGKF